MVYHPIDETAKTTPTTGAERNSVPVELQVVHGYDRIGEKHFY